MPSNADTATVNLVAGSTGAGKTSYSMVLGERIGGVRFSIDDWMGTLFWMDSPQPIQYAWAMERIDRCEKLIFENVRRLAKLGVPSILDLGFTRTDHREKFATLARGADLPIRLHWIDVPQEERWRRVMQRNRQRGETYEMDVDREMFDFMEGIWEAPTQAEMAALNGIRVAP